MRKLICLLLCLLFFPALADASALRLGYCESDPYFEFDEQTYYLLLGMEEYGLVSSVSDAITHGMTSAEMWETVCALDQTSWKVNFVKDAYASLADARFADDGALDALLEEHPVDLMLTMGTMAGLTVGNLPGDVRLMNFVAADPVKSGIVKSAASSGYETRWAHVDVDAFARTIQVMDDVFAPQRVGVVYADNEEAYIYSGADILDEYCRKRGITVEKAFVDDEFDDGAYALYIEQLHDAHAALADKIDVFILTTSLIEPEDFPYVLEPLLDQNIPVYSINSAYDVECGALLAAESSDFPTIGLFGADALSRYLHGESLSVIPQIYQTAPFLVVNYDTARRIGYRPSFELLLSAAAIYSK